jgi:hypothetical protein
MQLTSHGFTSEYSSSSSFHTITFHNHRANMFYSMHCLHRTPLMATVCTLSTHALTLPHQKWLLLQRSLWMHHLEQPTQTLRGVHLQVQFPYHQLCHFWTVVLLFLLSQYSNCCHLICRFTYCNITGERDLNSKWMAQGGRAEEERSTQLRQSRDVVMNDSTKLRMSSGLRRNEKL